MVCIYRKADCGQFIGNADSCNGFSLFGPGSIVSKNKGKMLVISNKWSTNKDNLVGRNVSELALGD